VDIQRPTPVVKILSGIVEIVLDRRASVCEDARSTENEAGKSVQDAFSSEVRVATSRREPVRIVDPEERRLRDVTVPVADFSQLLTLSNLMMKVFEKVRQVAPTDATALILGETGTGKELVSRAIHERSDRKSRPFVTVNCGAFAETLLESELFGHERGSFTGAVGRREGLFEVADGGTLFLDELGETSPSVQVNLLRVLEDMEFRRVGGRETVRVDVRIIAATNLDLRQAVAGGRFRSDLYHRLNVFPIHLPPLRERTIDIPLLMEHFLLQLATQYKLEPPKVEPDTMRFLQSCAWPGNVRQLRTLCERLVISRAGGRVRVDDLEADNLQPPSDRAEAHGVAIDEQTSLKDNLDRIKTDVERRYLRVMLVRHHGHLGRTADAAGITRRTLFTKMKDFGWSRDEFRA